MSINLGYIQCTPTPHILLDQLGANLKHYSICENEGSSYKCCFYRGMNFKLEGIGIGEIGAGMAASFQSGNINHILVQIGQLYFNEVVIFGLDSN